MNRRLSLGILLAGILLALPASAQIQYFGYAGGSDDDISLTLTKGFSNFAYVSASADLSDPFVRDRVSALSQQGERGLIDLGLVLWCDYDLNQSYRYLCSDWAQRWTTWKQNNAAVLTSDKVLGFAVLDEPFNRGAIMTDFETAAQRVKADFPWAKTLTVEAACVVAGSCASYWPSPGLGGYSGSLPGIDWLGVDEYGIHPASDSTFQTARSRFKSRFPGRKWAYVMDGYWDPNLHPANIGDIDQMGAIADEWYGVARNDPDAILLGVFLWPLVDGWTTSQQFSCDVLAHHVAAGRAILNRPRLQAAPTGSFSIDYAGILSGWACEPGGTLCESPQVDIYYDGFFYATADYGPLETSFTTAQCPGGVAYRFSRNVSNASGHRITVQAHDPATGSAALPSTCAENPACIWYSQKYAPKGYLDNVDATGYAYGWVCDQDAPLTNSQVRIVAGTTTVGFYTTNLSNEAAVIVQCSGGSYHRFGVQLPAWTRGLQITAYAENLGTPGTFGEIKIPVLCTNGTCLWH